MTHDLLSLALPLGLNAAQQQTWSIRVEKDWVIRRSFNLRQPQDPLYLTGESGSEIYSTDPWDLYDTRVAKDSNVFQYQGRAARFLAAVHTQIERSSKVYLTSSFKIQIDDYPECRDQMNRHTSTYRNLLKPIYLKGDRLPDGKDLAYEKILTPYEECGMILMTGSLGEFTEWILL